MDREEGLKCSRKSGEDEAEAYAQGRGLRIGAFGCYAMCAVLALFNVWNGQRCEEIFASCFAYPGAENWGKYRHSPTRWTLISAAAWSLLSLAWLFVYVKNALYGGT